jgi:hypothetical protein
MGQWMYRSMFSWPTNQLEVSGQFHALAALPPGIHLLYPLDGRLGGPKSRSGRYGEKKILDPTGTRTPTPRSSRGEVVKVLCYKPEGCGFETRWGEYIFFNLPNPFCRTRPLGFIQPVTKISTRSRKIMFLGSSARPVRGAFNLTAICEPII